MPLIPMGIAPMDLDDTDDDDADTGLHNIHLGYLNKPTDKCKRFIVLMSSGDSVYRLDESLELWRDTLLARTTVVPLAPPCGLRLTFGEGTGTLLQFRSCS